MPDQTGVTSYLDCERHVFGLGVGLRQRLAREHGKDHSNAFSVDAALGLTHLVPEEVRKLEVAGPGGDFRTNLNPRSLTVLTGARVEPSLALLAPGVAIQFERQGYFCADVESMPDHLVFNLAVALKDTWAKIEQKQK